MNAVLTFLTKFRRELIAVLFVCVIAACTVFPFTPVLVDNLKLLLDGRTELYQTMVGEALGARLLLAIVPGASAAVFIALWRMLQAFHRSKPALNAFAALVLYVGGGAFARYVILPLTVRMLTGVLGNAFTLHISLYGYVGFCITFMLIVALMFELPLATLLLYRLGLVKSTQLRRWRKGVILALLIVLAVLTPTQDIATLVIAALPFVVLYELSILWISFLEKAGAHGQP